MAAGRQVLVAPGVGQQAGQGCTGGLAVRGGKGPLAGSPRRGPRHRGGGELAGPVGDEAAWGGGSQGAENVSGRRP